MDCDTTTDEDQLLESSNFTTVDGRRQTTFTCTETVAPRCFTSADSLPTSVNDNSFVSSDLCDSVIESPRCGDGIVQPNLGEQCEAAPLGPNGELEFPSGCSTTCQLDGGGPGG